MRSAPVCSLIFQPVFVVVGEDSKKKWHDIRSVRFFPSFLSLLVLFLSSH